MRYLTILFFVLLSYGVYAQKPAQAPIPNWVEVTSYTDVGQEDEESGYYYLLLDKQVNAIIDSYYSRVVVKALTSEGVSQLSDLTFEFDPEYEKITFHKMEVIRDGEVINKLNINTIQTVQRESNLERKLYDGRLTSIVNLLDIRAGDILDYAYSVQGSNPVYEGDYGFIFNLQYSIPLRKLNCRLITDNNEIPEFDYKNGAAKPVIEQLGNKTIYKWSLEDVPAKLYDNNTPAWYDDYPQVYVSTHGKWDDIVKQYSKLYKLSANEKRQLDKVISQEIFPKKEIEKDISKSEQIVALIEFVQDDIRYFGFENGLSSHKPEPPLKVLNQRFGDCKGKSLVLVELLDHIGIEAYPMLVNTSTGESIDEKIPSPNLFNHCVVNYTFEGKSYYVDPTISNQGGDIDKRPFPNYKKGLILKPGENDLVDLPYDKESGIEIQEIYDVDAINGSGSLTIVTTYKGIDADATRADFALRNNANIQKSYLEFYSILFPTIQADEKISTEDFREVRNEFVTREHYKIDSLWQTSPDNEKLYYIEVYPLSLENYVSTVKSPARTSPYYVDYPASISYDISVNLPEEWDIEPINTKEESDYFSYTQDIDSYLNKVIISHTYNRKSDFIPAEDVSQYIKQQEKIKNDLSYYITYDYGLAEKASSGISWVALCITILALILSAYGAYKLYFDYDVAPRVQDTYGKPIGSWLVLIAIGLILTPIIILYTLLSEAAFFDAYTWSILWHTEGIQGKPYVILIVFELVFNIARMMFCIILIILFFERRTTVPRLVIIFFVGTLLFVVVDAIAAYTINAEAYTDEDDYQTFKDIFGSVIRAAIWIPYFLISDRVKNTFVKRSKNYKAPPLDQQDPV